MKTKVFYHSATGNTKKVAEAIAAATGCAAEKADSASGAVEADLLFLGGAVYATSDHDVHPALKEFVSGLDPKKVKRAAVFATGFERSRATGLLSGLLKARGIPLFPESFFCKGKFALFMMGHPDAADLERAGEFAAKALKG